AGLETGWRIVCSKIWILRRRMRCEQRLIRRLEFTKSDWLPILLKDSIRTTSTVRFESISSYRNSAFSNWIRKNGGFSRTCVCWACCLTDLARATLLLTLALSFFCPSKSDYSWL